jgi:hypothetical protein
LEEMIYWDSLRQKIGTAIKLASYTGFPEMHTTVYECTGKTLVWWHAIKLWVHVVDNRMGPITSSKRTECQNQKRERERERERETESERVHPL